MAISLISCDRCAAVLDASKITWPDPYREDGSVDTTKARWNGDDYIPVVGCPVCDNPIMKEE